MKLKLRGPVGVGLAGAVLVLLVVAMLIMPKAGQIKTRQEQTEKAKVQQSHLTLELEALRSVAKDADKNQ